MAAKNKEAQTVAKHVTTRLTNPEPKFTRQPTIPKQEETMFELTKAAQEQLERQFENQDILPIRIYMAAG
jgi:hypothetical protein